MRILFGIHKNGIKFCSFYGAEFGAASRLLAASSDWSSALSLNVKAAANVDRIAGYRLLAFYP